MDAILDRRRKTLRIIIIISLILLLFGIVLYFLDNDPNITAWIFALSQSLFVFSVFRFPKIKEFQKNHPCLRGILIMIFAIGVMVSFVGRNIVMHFSEDFSKAIMETGNFIAALGLNSLISYLSNYFDNIEDKENKEIIKEKKKRKKRRR